MTKAVHGVVHGRTIELAEDLGIDDGQAVEVYVRPLTSNGHDREPSRAAFSLAPHDMDETTAARLREIRERGEARPKLEVRDLPTN